VQRDHLAHWHRSPRATDRTAVCCLSSVNLETWDQWHGEKSFIEDIMRFLDNVLQDYIDRAPP
jgi:ribonucleoside-diphosphate reductase alpha chain